MQKFETLHKFRIRWDSHVCRENKEKLPRIRRIRTLKTLTNVRILLNSYFYIGFQKNVKYPSVSF